MKRDKLEIIRSILLICKNGAKKTKIVYEANLNFKKRRCLPKPAHRAELINKEDMYFKTTPKGAELLSNLKEVSASLDFR